MAWGRVDDREVLDGKIGLLTDREYRSRHALLQLCSREHRDTGVFGREEISLAIYATPGGPRATSKKELARFVELDLVKPRSAYTDDEIEALDIDWPADSVLLRIHKWEKYNPPRDRTNAQRQERHRNGASNAVTNAEETDASRTRQGERPPSRPVPSPDLSEQQQLDQTAEIPGALTAADLNDLLDRLDLRDPGVRLAAHQDFARAVICARRALEIGKTNPAGLFRRMLESGETPLVRELPKLPCPLCKTGGGLHIAGCQLSTGAA